MPNADGDFVKVYLYGLMQCYHPVQSASIETIARELRMEVRQVENAFGYWERVGLVRRVSDNPPAYAYINLKQLELNRAQDDDGLYRYADFNNSLQALFGPTGCCTRRIFKSFTAGLRICACRKRLC